MRRFAKLLLVVVTTSAAVLLFTRPACAVLIIDEGLDNTGTNSGIANNDNSGKAINFVMPAGSDFTLDNVVIGLGNVNNDEAPVLEIWSDSGGAAPIDSLLETLVNPGTLNNGANTFTSSGLTLEANETYWAVLRNYSSTFDWLGSTDTSVVSDIGATHTARLFPQPGDRANPSIWDGSSGVLNQIQVNATQQVVPEPTAIALWGLIGLILAGFGYNVRRSDGTERIDLQA